MRFDVITLVPELFETFLRNGITRRAFESGQVQVCLHHLRDRWYVLPGGLSGRRSVCRRQLLPYTYVAADVCSGFLQPVGPGSVQHVCGHILLPRGCGYSNHLPAGQCVSARHWRTSGVQPRQLQRRRPSHVHPLRKWYLCHVDQYLSVHYVHWQ